MLNTTDSAFDLWTKDWSSLAPTTYQGSEELAFQRWFKFKEAFSPSLVESVIEGMDRRPKHILDCCGGSGTTGVVSQFLGIESTLVEVNPFLADLIEAKLSDYQEIDLPSLASRMFRRAEKLAVDVEALRKRLPPTFIAPGVKQRWIFSEEVATAVESFRISINGCTDKSAKRLFKVALASILIELSNVRIDGKGRRYRVNWQARTVSAEDVRTSFMAAIKRVIEDIYRHARIKRSEFTLLRGDARKQIPLVKDKVDLVLFSPPYPNSFDYTDIYNIELWMLGYLTSFEQNTKLRQSTLRSHVQIAWEKQDEKIESPTLTRTLNELDKVRDSLWNKNLPAMVNSYFTDMQTLIKESSNKLSAGGQLAMVVGNSSYANVLIDVPKILCEIGTILGLKQVSSASARSMRSSIQQGRASKTLAESLVIMKKP
jgi:hypothetical protein